MQKIAFKMKLNPGMQAEYRARHAPVWPELDALLRASGVSDYSIHLDPETHILFATLWVNDDNTMADLPNHPVMQRWWAYMADIMLVNDKNEPVVTPLIPVFHLR